MTMTKATGYVEQGKKHIVTFTDDEIRALPNSARKIIKQSEDVRTAAYLYRREYVALRTALHDLCRVDAKSLKFEDSVLKNARDYMSELEELDAKDVKKMLADIRREVVSIFTKNKRVRKNA